MFNSLASRIPARGSGEFTEIVKKKEAHATVDTFWRVKFPCWGVTDKRVGGDEQRSFLRLQAAC